MDKEYYRIEEVAIRTELTKRAIRYYEDIDLIKPIRTEAKYRLYTNEDIEKIVRIKSYKDRLGFSLNEIRDVFELEECMTNLFTEEETNLDKRNQLIDSMKEQIHLIEKKEETMRKVKERYLQILSKLEEN